MQAVLHSRNACFTSRSSPEWYAMTASMPPGARRSRSAGSARARPSSSSLTAMRTAWKRRAKSDGTAARAERAADGADEIVARAEGPRCAAADDLAREPARARLVAEVAEDAHELRLVGLVEQLAGAAARVVRASHAHVERRTLPEGEAARCVVDLMRGDAKVEQDPGEAKVGDRGDGVDRGVVRPGRRRTGRERPRSASRAPAAASASGSRSTPITLPTPWSSSAARVAAATEGTVEDERRAAEQLDHLGGERRGMIVGVPGTRGALVEASRSVGHTTAEPRVRPGVRTLAHPTDSMASRQHLTFIVHGARADRARAPARRVVGAPARPRGGRARHVGGRRRHPPRRGRGGPRHRRRDRLRRRRHAQRSRERARRTRRPARRRAARHRQRLRAADGNSGGRGSCHGCYPPSQARAHRHGVDEWATVPQRVHGRRRRRGDGGDSGRLQGVARAAGLRDHRRPQARRRRRGAAGELHERRLLASTPSSSPSPWAARA